MTESKRARIWRRTWVGALLAAGLTLTLWVAEGLDNGWPILVASGLVLFAAVYEVGRMGVLRGRNQSRILIFPALATVLSIADAIRAFYGSTRADYERWQGYFRGTLLSEYLWALVFGVFAHFLMRGARRLGRWAIVLQVTSGFLLALGIQALLWHPERPIEEHWWLLAFAVLLFAFGCLGRPQRRRDLFVTLGLCLWLIVPLPALAKVWYLYDQGGLVSLLVLSKVGDIAGYYVGSAIGKRHPFPRISPGKTVAGCVASLVAGTLCGGLLGHLGFLHGVGGSGTSVIVRAMLAGLAVNVAAQSGDLLESWVKRRVGVKDSGHWFGPSGGVLDVVDSVLLSVPAALLIWPWIFHEFGS